MDVVLIAFASIFRCSVSPPSSNCITLSWPALYLSIHCLDAFHTPFCARKPAHTDYAGIYCILPELCTVIYIHHLYQSDNAIPRIVRPLKMLQTILHVQYLHLAVQCWSHSLITFTGRISQWHHVDVIDIISVNIEWVPILDTFSNICSSVYITHSQVIIMGCSRSGNRMCGCCLIGRSRWWCEYC